MFEGFTPHGLRMLTLKVYLEFDILSPEDLPREYENNIRYYFQHPDAFDEYDFNLLKEFHLKYVEFRESTPLTLEELIDS
ncbi:hypothetical protein HKH46_002686 [Enterococcus faecalis]|nr:hypothetical protein [Enterococcus faecalis]